MCVGRGVRVVHHTSKQHSEIKVKAADSQSVRPFSKYFPNSFHVGGVSFN